MHLPLGYQDPCQGQVLRGAPQIGRPVESNPQRVNPSASAGNISLCQKNSNTFRPDCGYIRPPLVLVNQLVLDLIQEPASSGSRTSGLMNAGQGEKRLRCNPTTGFVSFAGFGNQVGRSVQVIPVVAEASTAQVNRSQDRKRISPWLRCQAQRFTVNPIRFV